MSDLRKELELREKFLRELAENKKRALAHAPEGSLRASQHRKTVQYYRKTPEAGGNGRYLKVGERELARALAQKEYDRKVMQAAVGEQEVLEKLRAFCESKTSVEDIFSLMPENKKSLITPIELPIDEFAARWAAEPFTPLPREDNAAGFFSERGERMRSKSEVIIANKLLLHGIPYRYECPLLLNGEVVCPDFTILRLSDRTVIYWEHLGKMDDEGYRDKNIRKISRYELNGYFPGDRLILTFETGSQPLDTKIAELMIERFCR